MTTVTSVSTSSTLTGLVSVWSLETSDKMEQVTQPNYLVPRYGTFNLRRNDRVMVTADILNGAECGWLRVTDVSDGEIATVRTDGP